jgi:hypothetical protein
MRLKDLKKGDIVYHIEFYKDAIYDYSILEVKKVEFFSSFYGGCLNSSYVKFNSIIGEDDIFITGGDTELDEWIEEFDSDFKSFFTIKEDTFVQLMKFYAT